MSKRQKAKPLKKSLSSTQESKRPISNQQKTAGNNNDRKNNSAQSSCNPHNNHIASDGNANIINNRLGRKPIIVNSSCETCGETNHSTEKGYFGVKLANNRLPGKEER